MSSIIEGFEYDIFISYRKKDNKGDRCVSEFVEALKTEPESTFKEEINVYFDINLEKTPALTSLRRHSLTISFN